MTTASKECCRCRAVKDISEFSRDKYSSDGFTSQCKVCRNAIHKKWYDANPETVRKIIEDGKYWLEDKVSFADSEMGELKTVFQDGVLTRETSLAEIRQRLEVW